MEICHHLMYLTCNVYLYLQDGHGGGHGTKGGRAGGGGRLDEAADKEDGVRGSKRQKKVMSLC